MYHQLGDDWGCSGISREKASQTMKLPRNQEAVIPERKITGYLLSKSHPVGKSKAKYFRALGYSERNAPELKETLATIASMNEVSEMVNTTFGTKYIVDGILATPSGTRARVHTVWIVETGGGVPRFITAYPRVEGNKGVESD
jgi:hypothetical protein